MSRKALNITMTRNTAFARHRHLVAAAGLAFAIAVVAVHSAWRGADKPAETFFALAALAALLIIVGLGIFRLWAANRTLSKALDLQTTDLLQANANLRAEIDERRQAELALMRYKSHLEIQIKASTCELQKEVMDHRQAREMLSEYHLALEASDEMVTVLDRHYIFRMVNDAYLKRRRTARANIIGTPIVNAIGEDAFHAIKPHLDACFQGEAVEYEMVRENETMGKRHLLVRYYPARSTSGRVNRVVSVIKDITAVKRAEEDRERLFSSVHRSHLCGGLQRVFQGSQFGLDPDSRLVQGGAAQHSLVFLRASRRCRRHRSRRTQTRCGRIRPGFPQPVCGQGRPRLLARVECDPPTSRKGSFTPWQGM